VFLVKENKDYGDGGTAKRITTIESIHFRDDDTKGRQKKATEREEIHQKAV